MTFTVSTETDVPWHHLAFAVYDFLVNQNLYKACVNWAVAGILATVFVRRPWNKHKQAQARANRLTHANQSTIIDQLDPTTPGGMEQVVSKLDKLSGEISALRKDEP